MLFFNNPTQAWSTSLLTFLVHALTDASHLLGLALDEGSAQRTEICLTTHNTHRRQTSIDLAGFEPAIPASGWPQTHVLDRAVTGIGTTVLRLYDFEGVNKIEKSLNDKYNFADNDKVRRKSLNYYTNQCTYIKFTH